MRTIRLLLYLPVFIVGCTNTLKNQEANLLDSINQIQDKDSIQPAEVNQNAQSMDGQNSSSTANQYFPTYYFELLSEDSLEARITEGLENLLFYYSDVAYRTIQIHDQRTRVYEGEYDTVEETEEETQTWYFDSKFQLRAYSKSYFRDGEGRDTKSTFGLFSNDSLVAMSEHWIEDGQIGRDLDKRILASSNGGTDISREVGGEAIINYLSEQDRRSFESDILSLLREVNGIIEDEWKNGVEGRDDMVITQDFTDQIGKPQGETFHSTEYIVNKEVFRNYISREK